MLISQIAYSVEVQMAPSHPGEIGLQKAGAMAKAGPALNKVFAEHQAHLKAQPKQHFTPGNPFLQYAPGKIVIDAVASGDGNILLHDLKGLGLKQGARAGRIVSGWLPLGIIKKALDLESLRFISASYRPVTNAGDVTSQGDVAMYADEARRIYELDGAGITVGVLSDSYDQQNGAAADVTSGDLPGGIINLDDSASCGSLLPEPCTDEGRAMMQIVHDVAPGAGLAFHTAFTGMANFSQGIRDLAETAPEGGNAKVIVDDVMYYAEPMFQDGIIAKAVDDVVAGGAAYFSAAGNQARKSYEQDYVSSGEPLNIDSLLSTRFVGILHDFDPGESVDWLQSISVLNGTCIVVSLQWDQPFGSLAGGNGSQSDLDIYLIDGDESSMTILEKSDSDNVLSGDPVELLQFCNTANYSNLNLLISYFFEPDPGSSYDTWEPPIPTFMKYVYFGSMTVNEYATDSSTLYGHANAAGAEATGAAYYIETPMFYNDPPLLDYFSSAGGTPISFSSTGSRLPTPEVREKPEIVAPNGVDTTFFYPTSDRNSNGIPDFSGTSAAAPHAAAVAALMLEANMMATPDSIYTALEQTAVDMESTDFDFDSGWGLVKADDAVDAILVSNIPPTANFTYTTNYLNVDFTDQSTDDGSIVSWNWNFGDYDTSTTQNPTHTYESAGSYNVTLTVTDDGSAADSNTQVVLVTTPSDCNFDGICDAGEDCNNCPDDCISGDGVAECGNGICEASAGEDCTSCPADCNGKQVGADKRQFCCGDIYSTPGTNPVSCDDARCTEAGWLCSDAPPVSYCCGTDGCTGAENGFNCAVDCGLTETICNDEIDNDEDGYFDCDDPDCDGDASCTSCRLRGESCADDNECCSTDCHPIKGTCK